MMEAWPTVAWVLLMISVADWLKTVQSRDFTMMDIIMLHPSTTPHPGGFKCFTCQDAADNYECNRWAPDVYCPKDTRYCYTLHVMDNKGDSVSVTKRCVALQDCLLTGCADVTDNGYQVCSSCCEGNICNVLVPRNESSAIFSSTSPLVSSSRRLHPATLSCIIIIIIIIFTAGHV
uniref:ly6/PLAUR domain-containing protein 6-like n=1 Tax=Scatophagus argus TaxID=75038 RepID=UPI001ED80D10|nr:ly6/PLAUR domain-containing protein 6-like [Scatophagus argus]